MPVLVSEERNATEQMRLCQVVMRGLDDAIGKK